MTLCGFKIPLYTDDNSSWNPGKQQAKVRLSDAPVDLTYALNKGEKIMNMNLESFSQMFQESISSQVEQPVDCTVYTLKKIKVESGQNSYICQEEPMQAADLTLNALKGGHGGPILEESGLYQTCSPRLHLLQGAIQHKSLQRHVTQFLKSGLQM